jgi:hypothetical protein
LGRWIVHPPIAAKAVRGKRGCKSGRKGKAKVRTPRRRHEDGKRAPGHHEFSDLLSRVERGEEILITKRSKPVADLNPIVHR